MALSTGSLLAGRYEITAPVAVGGMGEVWRARDRVLDRVVAAKVLKSEFTGDPNFLARFRNEARHTAALSHPNIASVYDYGETLDEQGTTVAYLVMEFVEGQPLVTILHEEGRMPVDWTMHVLGQAADGLSAAHRAGVVHRDIKPGNIMVRPDGVAKLTDFGIAQARDATPLTRTGMVVGTAQYLSPEQAQGMEVTAASDVYSLGVVGYECLAGVRPFDGASQVAIALAHINRPPPPLPGDVPPPVRALVGRALGKDPAQRFPDGAAFADAVREVQDGGGTGGGAVAAAGAAGATTEVLSSVGDGAGTRVIGPASGALAAGAAGVAGAAALGGGPGTRARPLPPLQLADDEEPPAGYPGAGYAGGGAPPPRRRGPWGWVAAAVVVLVLLGLGAYLLLSGGGGKGSGATTPPPSTSSAAGPSTVTVDGSALVGQPYPTAAATLEKQGLVPRRATASSAQLREAGVALAAGDVAAVQPSGSVPVGGTVTLFVAASGYDPNGAPPTTAERTTAAPTTTARPTTTSSAPTTTTSAPPSTTTTAPSVSLPGTPLPSGPAPSGGAEGSGTNGGGGTGTGGNAAGGGADPSGAQQVNADGTK
jgi:serine/threonine-protein kinase